MKKPKFADGIIVQEAEPEEVADADGKTITIAFLRMFRDHGVGLMWSPLFFTNPNMPMPDELRAELVKLLRFHADRLESRELDERMKQIAGKMMGDA